LIPETEVQQKLASLKEKAPNPVPISALLKTNLDQLKKEALKMLKDYVRASFTIPLTNDTMPFISWLFKNADVQSTKYTENSVQVVFEASTSFTEKVRNRVRTLNGEFERLLE
jgi:50S ribosomal subunit-associated GTPase HflX